MSSILYVQCSNIRTYIVDSKILKIQVKYFQYLHFFTSEDIELNFIKKEKAANQISSFFQEKSDIHFYKNDENTGKNTKLEN